VAAVNNSFNKWHVPITSVEETRNRLATAPNERQSPPLSSNIEPFGAVHCPFETRLHVVLVIGMTSHQMLGIRECHSHSFDSVSFSVGT
jgi:hypothetical protein